MTDSTIIYTHTDEAPALATYSFLPVVGGVAAWGGGSRGSRGLTRWGGVLARVAGRP
ncbi:NADP-dependent isocitrate dehydrogenase [Streptomyces sp. NPDC059101]|uniref:NADP-dependent isocitrate dehydrogenase n=1 Tax=Streptomyces sp. NPDC059101 TaxID=3346728 RepID=UPI0036ACBFEA